MEEHCKSLALQYDLFINNTIKLLDTSIERDYIVKLKTIDELACKIHNGEDDKITIKKTLEAVQDECSKLSFKIKTSARLLDGAQVEKENILVENKTLKSQLEQLYSIFKKPDTVETSQTHHSHCSEYAQPNEKKTLNSTDALLSDLSYSFSEDSSYCNLTKNSKPKYARVKKCPTTNNDPSNIRTKSCEIKSVNGECGQIIATTTVTVDLDGINAKSIIKNQAVSTSKPQPISSSSTESLSSNESDKHMKHPNYNKLDTNIEKIHDFVKKIVVIPEICGQCHKKIKFNNYMVKCLDCKVVAHLECKDLISDMCTLDPNIIFALNCGIPPLIVYCINEIEKRGLDTNNLYRVSGSDEEVKKLTNQFHKVVPKLSNVDIHVICDCLKNFIHMQQNHLISQSDFSKFVDALENDNGSLSEGVIELPSVSRKILAFLILHLQNIINSPQCCMDYNSLAIVFGPIIIDLSSPICMDDLHSETEIIFKVLIELLKLPRSFWNNILKIDIISSDELLHSTPSRNQYKKQPPFRFFSSGSKKRILDLPKKKELKKVEFEKKN